MVLDKDPPCLFGAANANQPARRLWHDETTDDHDSGGDDLQPNWDSPGPVVREVFGAVNCPGGKDRAYEPDCILK